MTVQEHGERLAQQIADGVTSGLLFYPQMQEHWSASRKIALAHDAMRNELAEGEERLWMGLSGGERAVLAVAVCVEQIARTAGVYDEEHQRTIARALADLSGRMVSA